MGWDKGGQRLEELDMNHDGEQRGGGQRQCSASKGVETWTGDMAERPPM